jgi:hypothetical protein
MSSLAGRGGPTSDVADRGLSRQPVIAPAVGIGLGLVAAWGERVSAGRLDTAFSPDDLAAIEAAVREVESRSPGEVVPYATDRSDAYPEVAWITAAMGALLGGLAVASSLLHGDHLHRRRRPPLSRGHPDADRHGMVPLRLPHAVLNRVSDLHLPAVWRRRGVRRVDAATVTS